MIDHGGAYVPPEQIEPITDVLSTALGAEIAVLLGVAIIVIASVGGMGIFVFSRLTTALLTWIKQESKEREKQQERWLELSASQERISSKLETLGTTADTSVQLDRLMATNLKELTQNQRETAAKVQESTEQARRTYVMMTETHDVLKRGFEVTEERLAELPKQIATEVEPVLKRLETIQEQVERQTQAGHDLQRELVGMRAEVFTIARMSALPSNTEKPAA